LTPSIALPTGQITSITVDGQNVTVSGTTTGSPTSGFASITPASSNPGNAKTMGPTPITLSASTYTVTWFNMPPGNYASPVITFTNAGGISAPATGGLALSIIEISGAPQAPTPVGTGTIRALGTIILPSR
jgi:hypothetical protein